MLPVLKGVLNVVLEITCAHFWLQNMQKDIRRQSCRIECIETGQWSNSASTWSATTSTTSTGTTNEPGGPKSGHNSISEILGLRRVSLDSSSHCRSNISSRRRSRRCGRSRKVSCPNQLEVKEGNLRVSIKEQMVDVQ
jgi:hypothetical protein